MRQAWLRRFCHISDGENEYLTIHGSLNTLIRPSISKVLKMELDTMTSYRNLIALLSAIALSLVVWGCGSSSQMQGDGQEAAPPATLPMATTPQDSLAMTNQQLRDQVNALSSENRALTARVSFLESQLTAARGATPATAHEPASQPAAEAPAIQSPTTNSADMRTAYETALTTEKNHDFDKAIQQFQDLLNRSIRPDLADNCHYWLGECYYAQKKYDLAAQEFQSVIDMKTSDKTTDAMLMLGNTYSVQGKTADAKKIWNDLINSWPTSPAAGHAKARLASLK